MKRIIRYLYRRYCKPPEIKTLFLNGIQRNFDRILSEKEVAERNTATHSYLQSGWFEQIFNEELKEYVEGLFDMCETQQQRDYVGYAIRILLKFSERIERCGNVPESEIEFDKHKL